MSGVDFKRVAEVAVNAAFNEDTPHESPKKHNGHGAVKSVVAGAALVAVGRMAVKKAPGMLVHRLPSMAFGDLTDRVRDRLHESGWIGDHDDDEGYDEDDEELDDEPEDEVDLDEEDDEEPEEEDEPEDDVDEEDEEPVAEEDLEDEDEPEDEEDLEDEDEPEDEEEPEDEADLEYEDEDEDEEDDIDPDDLDELERIDPSARPPHPPRRKKRAKA